MSAVSTLYDALVARLQAKMPLLTDDPAGGWTRIPNPYDLPANSEQQLRQGWGLSIGNGSLGNGSLCAYMIDRTFRVVISREALNTDHDVTGIASVEKTLMEDLREVIRDFEKAIMLNGGQMFCTYVGDSGIFSVEGKGQARLAIEASFTTKLIENFS